MSRATDSFPGVVIFLAGVTAGVLTVGRRRNGGATAAAPVPNTAIASLADRINLQETAAANRFRVIEERLNRQATNLADVPSTGQLVAAMEQLLSKTMSSLDERLSTQARSIEVLKTTVSQTDSLLERVLESLDSLQSNTGSSEFAEDALLQGVG